MGGAEGVVDIQVAEFSKLGGSSGLIFFFFFVEAGVFQQHHVAVFHRGDGTSRLRPDAIHCQPEVTGLMQQLTECVGGGFQREFFSGPDFGRPK